MLISLVCLTPLFYWNYLNDFVSFGFHTGRISLRDGGLRFDFFLTELLGEIMYSNPVNYLLIVVATISLLNQKSPLKVVESRLFLWLGLPMIVTFLFFSLFRSTLPHWTGPAFQTLLLPAAAWLDQTTIQNSHKRLVPKIVIVSLVVQSLLLLAGSLQIKVGILPFKTSQDIHKLGEDDFSLDMYGWDEVKDPFERIREQAIRKGMMAENSRIIGENWFPLSHFDFYIARPLGMQVYGWGNLDRIHKYHWINKIQRETVTGESFWYLTTSRDFKDPNLFYGNDFREINLVDTIPIQRNSKVVKQIFVYTLVGLKMEAVNPADQP